MADRTAQGQTFLEQRTRQCVVALLHRRTAETGRRQRHAPDIVQLPEQSNAFLVATTRGDRTDDIAEQLDAIGIRPVQVVQQENNRLVTSGFGEQTSHRVVETEAILGGPKGYRS